MAIEYGPFGPGTSPTDKLVVCDECGARGPIALESEDARELANEKSWSCYETDADVCAHCNGVKEIVSRDRLPADALRYSDGSVALTNVCFGEQACGCKIVGNGTLVHPLSIQFCQKHRALDELAAALVRVDEAGSVLLGLLDRNVPGWRRTYCFGEMFEQVAVALTTQEIGEQPSKTVAYLGWRNPKDPLGPKTVLVFRDGRTTGLDPRFDLANHSPCGFEWGYGGSGPAQLALAILADYLEDDREATGLYQHFKDAVVARLGGGNGIPEGSWTLTGEEIDAALKKIRENLDRADEELQDSYERAEVREARDDAARGDVDGQDDVDEPPEPDDRAPCRDCGAPISDAEHMDNDGRCEECAGAELTEERS